MMQVRKKEKEKKQTTRGSKWEVPNNMEQQFISKCRDSGSQQSKRQRIGGSMKVRKSYAKFWW